MKALVFTCVFTLATFLASAQSFLNLDFEHAGYQDQPRKWVVEGEDEFSAALDSTTQHRGNKSLRIDLHQAQAYTFLSLPSALIAGKQIAITGYVKTDRADSLEILLAFKDPEANPTVFPLEHKENDKWLPLGGKASFPETYSSDRLLVAVIIMGSGRIWLDDFAITIDGVEIGNGKPDFREPLSSEIDIINKYAIELPELGQYPRQLGRLLGSASVLGLGENSHGSSTVFRTKFLIARYLIMKEEFTVFALESPVVEADSINAYVVNGIGTSQKILDHLVYSSWKTQEFADFIEWLRKYNKTAKVKVEFRGIDMQDGASALTALRIFCNAHEPGKLEFIGRLDSLYQAAASGGGSWEAVLPLATSMREHFERKDVGNKVSTVAELLIMQRYALILWQSIRLKKGGTTTESRDAFLADNVEWLYKTSGNNPKILVSADNSHVTKASGKMGAYLKRKLGDEYLNVATTFNVGTYSAYGSQEFYKVHPAYVGTYEYILSKCRYPNFLLSIQNPGVRPMFSNPAGFRSIGSRPQETTQFADTRLTDNFDVITYLEKSEHTTRKK